MSKSFQFERFQIIDPYTGHWLDLYARPESDGDYVKAEDAINREAVNADRIRVLELQLKEEKKRAYEFELKANAFDLALKLADK